MYHPICVNQKFLLLLYKFSVFLQGYGFVRVRLSDVAAKAGVSLTCLDRRRRHRRRHHHHHPMHHFSSHHPLLSFVFGTSSTNEPHSG